MGIQFLGFDFHIDFEALTLISQDIRTVFQYLIMWGTLIISIKLLFEGAVKLFSIPQETKSKESEADNTTETEGDKK